MALHAKEVSKLQRIIKLAEKLIANNPKPKRGRPALNNGNGERTKRANGKRVRRTGKDLVKFRKMLKAELKKGIPVAELARQQRVSRAYIYQL